MIWIQNLIWYIMWKNLSKEVNEIIIHFIRFCKRRIKKIINNNKICKTKLSWRENQLTFELINVYKGNCS